MTIIFYCNITHNYLHPAKQVSQEQINRRYYIIIIKHKVAFMYKEESCLSMEPSVQLCS